MRFPRDIDIRSGAFCLFAFVVLCVFGTLSFLAISCRLLDSVTCVAAEKPEMIATIRGWIENVLAILLALMAGSRTPPPPNPKDPP